MKRMNKLEAHTPCRAGIPLILSLALHPLVGVHGPVVGRQDHARCAEDGHGDARAGHEFHHAVAALGGDGAEAANGGGAEALDGSTEERHFEVRGVGGGS